jgi:hypothetical protein
MKKNFSLTAPNKQPARQVESVKYQINKYIARERRKAKPEGVDFWDFDCKVGPDAESAKVAHVAEIGKKIDEIAKENAPNCYVEILAKPGIRQKKPS